VKSHYAMLLTAAFSMIASAQTPIPKVLLTLDQAQTIARQALSKCHADGYNVTVLVVDSLNAPKILLRADGAPASTTEIAKMKATAAMLFDRPSENPVPSSGYPPAALLPGTINSEGGVPIKIHGLTVGAIAVSGAPGGDKDAACANAALTKFYDSLK
jgi:uncharacterized protein GlcG (DUF336 family)